MSISRAGSIRRARANCTALGLAAGALLLGCSKSPFDLAPVHGTVTIAGRPLTSGKVMFAPAARGDATNAGKPALGLIQSDGSYTLTTYSDGDGAVVGDHWVTVFVPDPKSPPKKSEDGSIAVTDFKRLAVPNKQTVASGTENQIDVKL
jgi:hypothetical protein